MLSKVCFFAFFFTFISFSFSKAQPYKVSGGLRLGSPASFSLKYLPSKKRAIEGFLGFRNHRYYSWTVIGGTYSYYDSFLDVDGLYWFGGGGASLFIWSWKDKAQFDNESNASIGLLGHLGLDYKFDDIPLNLSLDWMPVFFLNGYGSGLSGGYGALGVRYVFK
jgi:hypothetical protein